MYESGFDSAAARAHLDRQFATIDVIQELMERINCPPTAGSDVARLDSEVGDNPVSVSKSVHTGLSTATDCLVDIASILRRSDSKLTSSSVRSLMRTALLGSSRAAFVLVPDQHENRVAAAEVVVRQEWFSLERAFDALSPARGLDLAPRQDRAGATGWGDADVWALPAYCRVYLTYNRVYRR